MYSTYVILIHVYMYAIQRELSFSHYIMILLECDVTHGGEPGNEASYRLFLGLGLGHDIAGM